MVKGFGGKPTITICIYLNGSFLEGQIDNGAKMS
jgi:hypothetical protein